MLPRLSPPPTSSGVYGGVIRLCAGSLVGFFVRGIGIEVEVGGRVRDSNEEVNSLGELSGVSGQMR